MDSSGSQKSRSDQWNAIRSRCRSESHCYGGGIDWNCSAIAVAGSETVGHVISRKWIGNGARVATGQLPETLRCGPSAVLISFSVIYKPLNSVITRRILLLLLLL